MNKNYDRIDDNLPIVNSEFTDFWIYEGSEEDLYTSFTGKNLNRAGKSILVNQIFLEKIIQLNKSLLGIFEGNFEIYTSTKKYKKGDVVLANGSFYVSMTGENNKSLSDEIAWYKFTYRQPIQNDFFLREDEDVYRVFIKDGDLTTEKVED